MNKEYKLGELKLIIDSEITWLDECMENEQSNKEDILSIVSENNFERY